MGGSGRSNLVGVARSHLRLFHLLDNVIAASPSITPLVLNTLPSTKATPPVFERHGLWCGVYYFKNTHISRVQINV